MSRGEWIGSAEELRSRVALDLGGVWSLAYAAEIGALRLAQLPGADEDFALTAAAGDFGDAVDVLEDVAPGHPDALGPRSWATPHSTRSRHAGRRWRGWSCRVGHARAGCDPARDRAGGARGRRDSVRPVDVGLLADHRHPAVTHPPGPVTYGELLDLVADHLARAGLAPTEHPPVSPGAMAADPWAATRKSCTPSVNTSPLCSTAARDGCWSMTSELVNFLV